jgi:hypothetical protein
MNKKPIMPANKIRESVSCSFGIKEGKKYVTPAKNQAGMSRNFTMAVEMKLTMNIKVRSTAAPRDIENGIDETLLCKYPMKALIKYAIPVIGSSTKLNQLQTRKLMRSKHSFGSFGFER